MTKTNASRTHQLFDQLDKWRHLPAYQLERRADIFFSLYLPEVLQKQKQFELKHRPVLIPEFPCRIGTVDLTKSDKNRSFKIDYLAVSAPDKKAYFVELKTDNASRKKPQDKNMERAQEVGLSKLICGVDLIEQKTIEKKKYENLSKRLDPYRKWQGELSIVYVLPCCDKKLKASQITFAEFAEIVETHTDEFSQRFGRSLREWAQCKAG